MSGYAQRRSSSLTSFWLEHGLPLDSGIGLVRRRSGLLGRRAAWKVSAKSRMSFLGGVGDGNLGDELMFRLLQTHLPRQRLVPCEFEIQERRLATLRLSGPTYFNAGIVGGGTLINPYWLPRARLLADWGLPLYALGTGVGAQGMGVEETSLRAEDLPPFTLLGVRGPHSQARLASVGIQSTVLGDLALSLAPQPQNPLSGGRYLLNTTDTRGEGHALSREVQDRLGMAVRALHERGWNPIPVAMHHSDMSPLRDLLSSAHLPTVEVRMCRTPEDFADAIREAEFSLTVRLHAAVLSVVHGRPVLALAYRDKVDDFLSSIGLETSSVPWSFAGLTSLVGRAVDMAHHPTDMTDALVRVQRLRAAQKGILAEVDGLATTRSRTPSDGPDSGAPRAPLT